MRDSVTPTTESKTAALQRKEQLVDLSASDGHRTIPVRKKGQPPKLKLVENAAKEVGEEQQDHSDDFLSNMLEAGALPSVVPLAVDADGENSEEKSKHVGRNWPSLGPLLRTEINFKTLSSWVPALKTLGSLIPQKPVVQESSSLLIEGQELASKLTKLKQFADVLSGLWAVTDDNKQIQDVLASASSELANFSFDQDDTQIEQTFGHVTSLPEDAEFKIARVLNCMQLSQLTEAMDDGVLEYPEVLRLRQLASAAAPATQTNESSAMIENMAVTSASLEWQRKQERRQKSKGVNRFSEATKAKAFSVMRAALTIGVILSLGYGTYTAWDFYQVERADVSHLKPLDIYEISPVLTSGGFAGRPDQRAFVGQLDFTKWSALEKKDKEELLLRIWHALEGNKGFRSVALFGNQSMVAHLSDGKVRFVR
ncbi:MAG: hypothetical protein IPJ88_08375 [Myxococcales bacterium]|nr:MAG: hypothetical protein IPJ88_08375 [Myxococcales bacterium]